MLRSCSLSLFWTKKKKGVVDDSKAFLSLFFFSFDDDDDDDDDDDEREVFLLTMVFPRDKTKAQNSLKKERKKEKGKKDKGLKERDKCHCLGYQNELVFFEKKLAHFL